MDDGTDNGGSSLLITESERKKLLAELRTRLFWVGEKIPYFVEINGKKCKPHDRVWDLINKETLSDDENKQIEKCIAVLKEKESVDELELETKEMTREEAKTLSDETAGLLRAIMDLREIKEGVSKKREKEFHEMFSTQRTEEIRRWLNFLKEAEKK
ncbi:hypothetical protein Metho_0910 [Methanomethylovorans hollandica DSM 15978]|jgi:hypothetical protein|uniref:Uncharacterized protein n=1 Tax=Methanomethylovorans hollandica (strain DSM 15978 / NBRC 107637 / DMS1) TaxID=867904 RepID=L0KUM6_METHD|nr:DUF5788 family protein [Methanomethylovorans hollandica]AGB49152.1 hypothetical protein Metho_0910 [Methanomethylovorans hollandica DSM 15978]